MTIIILSEEEGRSGGLPGRNLTPEIYSKPPLLPSPHFIQRTLSSLERINLSHFLQPGCSTLMSEESHRLENEFNK
jgi:hypothetical protein